MENKTPQECAQTLRDYNAWRRGNVEECNITPEELGAAIAGAVAHLETDPRRVVERAELAELTPGGRSLYSAFYKEAMSRFEKEIHLLAYRYVTAVSNVAKRMYDDNGRY